MKPMKRAISAFVFLVVLLTGCHLDPNYIPPDFFVDYDVPEWETVDSVIVTSQFSEYDRNVEKITLTVINNTGDDIYTDDHFSFQKKQDGEWREVAGRGMFNLQVIIYPTSSSHTHTVTLKDRIKLPLPAGEYRAGIIFSIGTEEKNYVSYAEFTVK